MIRTAFVLFLCISTLPRLAHAAEDDAAPLRQDGSAGHWLEPLHGDDCTLRGSGIARPCLVPKFVPASSTGDDAGPILAPPPSDNREPQVPQPVPEQQSLAPLLSSVSPLWRGDLALPMLNLVGMTVLPRTFGKYVSLEKDWRTSQGLLRLHADLGRFHPFVEGSLMVIDSRVVNIFLPEPGPVTVLREDRKVAELLFLGAARSPYWFGGVTVDLGKGFAVALGGTALYLDRPFAAGALILTFPLGPK